MMMKEKITQAKTESRELEATQHSLDISPQ